MKKVSNKSGADTMFSDKDGKPIKVHDYVKDAEGNRYYINSYAQAVPEGGDAPAEELSKLLERTEVSVMSIEDVLNMKKPVEHKRRGGRKAKAATEAPAATEEKKDPADQPAAAVDQMDGLQPVTEQMILGVIPDNVLANELRRRGYTLCAVRPALIEL